jgi:hypothetical protein
MINQIHIDFTFGDFRCLNSLKGESCTIQEINYSKAANLNVGFYSLILPTLKITNMYGLLSAYGHLGRVKGRYLFIRAALLNQVLVKLS